MVLLGLDMSVEDYMKRIEIDRINREIDKISREIRKACELGDLPLVKKLLISSSWFTFESYMFYDLFPRACGSGNIYLAKFLYELVLPMDNPYFDPSHDTLDVTFGNCCCSGKLELAKWILEIKPIIDISYDDDYLFRFACEHGYVEVAKWLFDINPSIDISVNNHKLIRYVCQWGELEMVEFLVSINQLYSYIYTTNGRIRFILKTNTPLLIPIHSDIIYIKCLEEEDKECIICKCRAINLQTNCKHNFCTECISEWYGLHQNCPYCRANISTCSTIVIA